MFHVLKTPVYRFDYYGSYRTLWSDEANFWYISLNIKLGVNRTSHVFKSLVFRLDFYGRYQIMWTDIAHFQYQPAYG